MSEPCLNYALANPDLEGAWGWYEQAPAADDAVTEWSQEPAERLTRSSIRPDDDPAKVLVSRPRRHRTALSETA